MNMNKCICFVKFESRSLLLLIALRVKSFMMQHLVPVEGAPLPQLVECRTLDRKVAGANLTRDAAVSLSKTLHLHCLVLFQPWKPSR